MKNYYAVLDLPPTATPEQLRTRYKQLIRIYHPDRFPNHTDKAYAEERLKAINAAYEAVNPTVQHRRPPVLGKRATMPPKTQATSTSKPTPAQNPITPFVQMRRVVQHVVISGGIILTGLAATPLLSSVATPFDTLWHEREAKANPAHASIQTQPAIFRQAPVDWVPITSPNGQQMVFILRQEGLEMLYVRDHGSGRLHAVTHDSVNSASFVWSPDENKLAFIADVQGIVQLYILDLPTAQVEQIAEIKQGEQLSNFHWSADGKFTQ